MFLSNLYAWMDEWLVYTMCIIIYNGKYGVIFCVGMSINVTLSWSHRIIIIVSLFAVGFF